MFDDINKNNENPFEMDIREYKNVEMDESGPEITSTTFPN